MSDDPIDNLRQKLLGSARHFALNQCKVFPYVWVEGPAEWQAKHREVDARKLDAHVVSYFAGVAQILDYLADVEPIPAMIAQLQSALELAARDFGRTKEWLENPPGLPTGSHTNMKCALCGQIIVVDDENRYFEKVPLEISDQYIPKAIRDIAAVDGYRLRARPYIIRADPKLRASARPNNNEHAKSDLQVVCFHCWPKIGPVTHVEQMVIYDKEKL